MKDFPFSIITKSVIADVEKAAYVSENVSSFVNNK